MESKERIRAIHINTSSGMFPLFVGSGGVDSGREEITRVTKIEKVMGIGPHGAVNVYRVHCEGDGVKERIEIPGEAVALTILEEVK